MERTGQNYILAFWHGRLLMMPYCYRRRKIAIIISEHGDGELIARTMALFGHQTIRGSSTRGGAGALRQAIRHLRRGGDIGFTPDGPRGPRFRVQPGVIQAARLGRVPIIPVSFSARPAHHLASWDRFLLPWPFSRGLFLYGRPIRVPPDADAGRMEAARLELEGRLRRLILEGDRCPPPPEDAKESLTSV
ncbi:MAG: lysophospholipid acyltransferase family protein [Acidobacteriota bacterium]